MLTRLRRMFFRQTERAEESAGAEYRFEMVELAADKLRALSRQLERCAPPEIPKNMAHTRGWTIRFEGLADYSNQIPNEALERLAKRLDPSIKILSAYIHQWERQVSEIDPLLQTFEIMPGDEEGVASVRILLDRALFAQRIAIRQLRSN